MGKNKISQIGQDVAKVLKLDNAKSYTGHCFRRTAATFAADGGASTTAMKRHFGWKSENTAMKYVNKSEKGAAAMALVLNPSEPSTSDALAVLPSTSGGAGVVNKTVNLSSNVDQREMTSSNKVYNIQAGGDNNTYNFY